MSVPRPRIDPLPGPSRRGLLVLAALPTAASVRTIVPAPSAHAATIAVAPVERTAPTVRVPTAVTPLAIAVSAPVAMPGAITMSPPSVVVAVAVAVEVVSPGIPHEGVVAAHTSSAPVLRAPAAVQGTVAGAGSVSGSRRRRSASCESVR